MRLLNSSPTRLHSASNKRREARSRTKTASKNSEAQCNSTAQAHHHPCCKQCLLTKRIRTNGTALCAPMWRSCSACPSPASARTRCRCSRTQSRRTTRSGSARAKAAPASGTTAADLLSLQADGKATRFEQTSDSVGFDAVVVDSAARQLRDAEDHSVHRARRAAAELGERLGVIAGEHEIELIR